MPKNLPEPPSNNDPVNDHNEKRLWVGNIDTRITEFALLKVLQKHGTLEKFDFLYHKAGPDVGKPRGYCFVSYASKQEAELAMGKLNGKMALSKRLSVKWAHLEDSVMKGGATIEVNKPTIPSGTKTVAEPLDKNVSACSKIRAIEQKLAQLDKGDPTEAPKEAVWTYDPMACKPQPPKNKPMKKPYERPRRPNHRR